MQWKCLPVPKDAHGQPAIHDTTVYRALAKWADDGSLQQALIASMAHLSAEKHLDLCVLHGDGTNTVAKKGGWSWLLGVQIPAEHPSPTRMPCQSDPDFPPFHFGVHYRMGRRAVRRAEGQKLA